MNDVSILDQIRSASTLESALKEKFELNSNPFPKSGIANLGTADDVMETLSPVDDDVMQKIAAFLSDIIAAKTSKTQNQYLSMVLRGEYGTGKTHTLMYIKYLCQNLNIDSCKLYAVYIDNPGQKLSDLIGGIIAQIGIENFRRYLWNHFMSYLDEPSNDNPKITKKQEMVGEINKNYPLVQDLFNTKHLIDETIWKSTTVSYKYLLDQLYSATSPTIQKLAIQVLRNYLIKYFTATFESSSVAEYFYDIVTDNLNAVKAWDSITSGNVKNVDRREVYLLRAIVDIVKKSLGYTDFVILVDEFEEIAAGRLKDAELDNYLRNLRVLIDREQTWSSVFAMNAKALQQIERVSPPLASRIEDRIIDLKPLGIDSLRVIMENYLSMARQDHTIESIAPFTEDALNILLTSSTEYGQKGSPRFIFKTCYQLLQRAAEKLNKGNAIDADFVKREISLLY